MQLYTELKIPPAMADRVLKPLGCLALVYSLAVWVYSRGIEQNGNYKKNIKYKRIRILHTSLAQIPTIEVTWLRTLY